MLALLGILALICSVGSLICLIIVVIDLFKIEGVLLGICGVICGLYTFIWGWMKVDQIGKRNVMLIWTGLIIAGIVLNILVRVMAPSTTAVGAY